MYNYVHVHAYCLLHHCSDCARLLSTSTPCTSLFRLCKTAFSQHSMYITVQIAQGCFLPALHVHHHNHNLTADRTRCPYPGMLVCVFLPLPLHCPTQRVLFPHLHMYHNYCILELLVRQLWICSMYILLKVTVLENIFSKSSSTTSAPPPPPLSPSSLLSPNPTRLYASMCAHTYRYFVLLFAVLATTAGIFPSTVFFC